MNKLCVIAKNKQTYFIKRLMEEVGHVELFDPWSDLEMPVADLYLGRTTGVYHSELDLLMMSALPKLVNPLPSLKLFRRKSTQYTFFEEHDLPCLPWISLKNADPLSAEKFTVLYPEVVVKPDIGQGGWGIEVLRRESLKSWQKKHDSEYLLQPFIKDGTEYRYFFIKGQSPVVLKRKAKTGISANFKKQGEAMACQLPSEFVAEVERLVFLSGAHYGAIDLLVDQDRLYILELNTVPGVEQLEKTTGLNILKQIVKSFAY